MTGFLHAVAESDGPVKFDYTVVEVDPLPGQESPQYIFEPVVTIEVIGPSGTGHLIRGLVDTGADFTILPMRYLPRLGLTRGPSVHLGAAGGGGFKAYLGQVDFTLWNASRKTLHSWSALVGFVPGRERALWGRSGFLDFYRATFDGPVKRLTLDPVGPFPEPLHGP